jgi:hypothetical protein
VDAIVSRLEKEAIGWSDKYKDVVQDLEVGVTVAKDMTVSAVEDRSRWFWIMFKVSLYNFFFVILTLLILVFQ